jgi:hypothetical protein
MRDQYKVLTEKYELVLEADTEQLATPQGREIKGVFVPTEIENWINNVMYRPIYDNKSFQKKFIRNKKADLDYTTAQLKTIVNGIYNKWKNRSFKEVQDALNHEQTIYRALHNAKSLEKLTPKEIKTRSIKYNAKSLEKLTSAKQAFNTGNLHTTDPLFRTLIVRVLIRARKRAREEGLPFFYSTDFANQLSLKKEREEAIDYIISVWPKDNICPAIGVKLNLTIGGTTNSTPELDKIIPERGYVKGNVAIISKLANKVKSNGNLNDLDKVYEYSKKGTKVLKEIKNHLNGYKEEIDNPVAIHKSNTVRNGRLCRQQRLHSTVGTANSRAKEKNVPFNVSTEYLRNIFPVKSAMICPALGIPLIWSNNTTTDNTPSLDRIIPGLGYVEGNVCFISHKANTMKNDATTEQIKGVRDWFKRVTQAKQIIAKYEKA